MNGPSAQLLVTRGLKSGLELAVEDLGHVWERAQRQKIAWRQSVQVVNFCVFNNSYFTKFQDLSRRANGKTGDDGPNAQQHVARDTESELELAVEVRVLVQESLQGTNPALWLTVVSHPAR